MFLFPSFILFYFSLQGRKKLASSLLASNVHWWKSGPFLAVAAVVFSVRRLSCIFAVFRFCFCSSCWVLFWLFLLLANELSALLSVFFFPFTFSPGDFCCCDCCPARLSFIIFFFFFVFSCCCSSLSVFSSASLSRSIYIVVITSASGASGASSAWIL